MAGRILGMGDMLTLIEQAEQAFEKDQAEAAATKLLEGEFTLDDFLDQMQQLKKMGPLGGLLGMMPGMPKELKGAEIGDDDTPARRGDHPLDDPARAAQARAHQRQPTHPHRQRADGTTADVNRLVKQFGEMQKMMKKMGGLGQGQEGQTARPRRGPGRDARRCMPTCRAGIPATSVSAAARAAERYHRARSRFPAGR